MHSVFLFSQDTLALFQVVSSYLGTPSASPSTTVRQLTATSSAFLAMLTPDGPSFLLDKFHKPFSSHILPTLVSFAILDSICVPLLARYVRL